MQLIFRTEMLINSSKAYLDVKILFCKIMHHLYIYVQKLGKCFIWGRTIPYLILTVGQNGDFADIRGHLKGTKCYRGSWQLVLTYERDKSNGSQSSFKTFIFRGVNTIIRA